MGKEETEMKERERENTKPQVKAIDTDSKKKPNQQCLSFTNLIPLSTLLCQSLAIKPKDLSSDLQRAQKAEHGSIHPQPSSCG